MSLFKFIPLLLATTSLNYIQNAFAQSQTVIPFFGEDNSTARVNEIYQVNEFYLSQIGSVPTGSELLAQINIFIALTAPTIEDLATLQTAIVNFKATLNNNDGSNTYTSIPLALFNAVDNLQKVVEATYSVNLIGDVYNLNINATTIIQAINVIDATLGINGTTILPGGTSNVQQALDYLNRKTNYVDFDTVNQTVVGSRIEIEGLLGGNADTFTDGLGNFTSIGVPTNTVSGLNIIEGQINLLNSNLNALTLNVTEIIPGENTSIYSCGKVGGVFTILETIATVTSSIYDIGLARQNCSTWALSTSDHYLTDSNALPLSCTKYLDVGSAIAGCTSYIQYTLNT